MGITSRLKPEREQLAWYWLWIAIGGTWTVYLSTWRLGWFCWVVMTVACGVGVLLGALCATMFRAAVWLVSLLIPAAFVVAMAMGVSVDGSVSLAMSIGPAFLSVGLAPAMACALFMQYRRRARSSSSKPAVAPGL